MNLFLKLAWRTILLLVFYQIVRFIFFAYNYELYSTLSTGEILQSFIKGIRFDLSAIALVNGLYFLFLIWPTAKDIESGTFGKLFKILFVLSNGIFIGLNIADAEYYKFVGRRLTYGSFDIVQDINNQAASIISSYWMLSLCGLITFPLLWILYDSGFGKLRANERPWIIRLGRFIALLGILVIAVRGGTQAYPLTVTHAYIGQSHQIAQLRLNSTLTVVKSMKSMPLKPATYFKSWSVIHGILNSNTMQSAPVFHSKPNVVVIILESFNLEYTGMIEGDISYTPFLKKLSEKGTLFIDNFANGRRSIDALSTIFGGLPSLMKEPFITSEYQTTQFRGLPSILVNEGYQTAFFHGGHDGTMFFDIQANKLGFSEYYGSNSFPDQSKDDGKWGIFDEPFFNFTVEKINTFEEPFMASLFSLSSHHPYKIPEQYGERFPEGPLDIHKSIRYTDYSLKLFFEAAKNQPWFDNTLFIITADHTSKPEKASYKNLLSLYRVPLLFYHPTIKLPMKTKSISQHVDILPTVLDLLGIESEHARFGRSLLGSSDQYALLFRHDRYILVRENHALRIDQFGEETFYNWRKDLDLKLPYTDNSDEAGLSKLKLRALIQYYKNGLIENNLEF
jgi:phosphoglycerol transferase MdoB-like AlkP superfamily enzyme